MKPKQIFDTTCQQSKQMLICPVLQTFYAAITHSSGQASAFNFLTQTLKPGSVEIVLGAFQT